jgi:hypothetical protein
MNRSYEAAVPLDSVITPTPLVIADLPSGLDFLSRLPLGNPQHAGGELNRFLDGLLHAALAPGDCLDLLEQSRVPLCFVAEELARHYVDKPLPLSHAEEANFSQVVTTWLKAARAYAHCARVDERAGDAEQAYRRALMLHRSIYYTGMALVEHHRARRELPPGLWLDLHGYYAAAETSGVAALVVPDALDPLARDTHCTAAFISLLLAELAGAYSLSLRQQNLVRRWASNWSPLVSLHPVVPGEPLPPFVIDLQQDAGVSPANEVLPGSQARRLDTSRLAWQLGQVRQQLRQKVAPAQIGLGEDCSAAQCRRLLEHLASPWTQVLAPRRFRRRATSGIARICVGFEAMHFYISGKEFAQPASRRANAQPGHNELFAARRPLAPLPQEPAGLATDLWEEVDQSANGFRLKRSTIGQRMAHGQLLAICPHGSEHFLLARMTWLMQEHGGGLIAGVAALSGLPQAVAARPLGPPAAPDEAFGRAFLLPAVPAVGAQPSLVLAPGGYRRGRQVEIRTPAASWRVTLRHRLDDGPDFEQASFDRVA